MLKNTNVTLEEGHNNCLKLCSSYKKEKHNWNEANTRFHFIDELLTKCFGWPRDSIDVEHHVNGEYSDYVLGKNSSKLVLEAKKEGIHFEIPAGFASKNIVSIKSLIATSKECRAAVEQTLGYCASHGIEFGLICNGPQLIAFVGTKIGEPPLSGKAFIIKDLDDLINNFAQLWNNLCPDGIIERKLYRLLTTGTTSSLPDKPSSRLREFPKFRYPSSLQGDLRKFSEFLIEDIPHSTDIEKQFYEECYCDTGALSRDALLGKDILMARYASLFPNHEDAPILQSIDTRQQTKKKKKKKGDLSFSKDIAQEALSRRPIVLLGDGGVGKSSFIKNLMLVGAPDEFEQAIFLYIDLGNKGTLTTDINGFILDEVQRQLENRYEVDVEETQFVKGVYDLDTQKFKRSIHAEASSESAEASNIAVLNMLAGKAKDKPEHLKESINHIAKGRKKQIIIIIDNADQRSIEVQQKAFVIAQDFANNWKALTFIAVRPITFFKSKRSGTLSAYPHRVFTISPPRPEFVIEKRLRFALNICMGKTTHSSLPEMTFDLRSMALFLNVLITSIEKNREIKELLANITGGNIRELVDFIKKFIGNPNIDVEKITDIQANDGNYFIPLHEFSKAAMLGDYSHFNPESSMATNLFSVEYADEREHFLCPLILAYLISNSSPKDKDGFTNTSSITEEMLRVGYSINQIEAAFKRLTNKKLIETTQRLTFEETDDSSDVPFAFRLTSIGSYHHERWLANFSYLDAMIFDTPIFDDAVFQSILPRIEFFNIEDRLERTTIFKQYLSSVWNKAHIDVPYFNWQNIVERDAHTYKGVKAAVKVIEAEDRKAS